MFLYLPLLIQKISYEGLLSDWMDENKNINRIVISQDYKINGKKCSRKNRSDFEPVKDGHSMDQAICFQYYNPIILDYIASENKMNLEIKDHSISKRIKVVQIQETELDKLIFPFNKHSIQSLEDTTFFKVFLSQKC